MEAVIEPTAAELIESLRRQVAALESRLQAAEERASGWLRCLRLHDAKLAARVAVLEEAALPQLAAVRPCYEGGGQAAAAHVVFVGDGPRPFDATCDSAGRPYPR